ncbi:hypothetical protein LU604_03510 [Erwinia tracheiphila]|uniref:Uncharacterized protein n=1 Tax=Erwinia tracheiphila TaxID=65700 RepID=A0A345CUP8_9GAMM|nr:hypothetical protein [Erwinia tracheiphila]AXF77165.1 hypothetical protein AV903_15845 [Erwinia tracheiphila]UIA84146.1 hypothetical protein LU604_03510 [Erwinia tracheiphila]UIA92728.1 hypothetical protein LU632_03470 [Erwinia tracheiphila]
MKETAVQFAKDLRLVFENTHNELDEIGIPFFYSFPKNSCQGASVYLSLFLTWIFPDASISVVKGSNRKRDEHHYWVELNNEVYDLTNDQFDDWLGERYHGLDLPVYAEKKHPLRNYFFYKEREPAIYAYATFCTVHANVEEVDKAQWIVVNELRKLGWKL